MKNRLRIHLTATSLLLAGIGGLAHGADRTCARLQLPRQAMALGDEAAAAFLLDRLTFGARSGDVEALLETGLDCWFEDQLAGAAEDAALAERLGRYPALAMDYRELAARYPGFSQMSGHLRRFHPGVIPGRDETILDFSVVAAAIEEFRAENGFEYQEVQLHEQLLGQKIERAVYAENQLREVMTDFWHNHFFTSTASFSARMWILPFESEAIRPNALGDFRAMLGAVSRHPAMRTYFLYSEQAAEIGPGESTMDMIIAAKAAEPGAATVADAMRARAESEIIALEYEDDLILNREFWPKPGPNPAYADALVRLHTLGPDADVSDDDMAAVARTFTGWTNMPVGPSADWYERGFKDALEVGFVVDGSFLFRADQHDARAKQVFELHLPAGGGIEEGERVLDYLAAHSDTARHIARKLAVRFVSEQPSTRLVGALARTFEDTDGDISAVMRTLVESREFWDAASERSKVRTPLEFAASALRASAADLESTEGVAQWIAGMGQPLYTYLQPSGFPDKNAYWLDSAAVVQRMNFAEQLTHNEIEGVTVAIPAGTSTPSRRDVESLAARLLPGRELGDTVDTIHSSADDGRAVAALLIASPQFQMR